MNIDYAVRYAHLVEQTRYSVTTAQPEWALRSAFEAGVCAWTQLIGTQWADPDLEALVIDTGRKILAHNAAPVLEPAPVDVLFIASTISDFGGHSVMLEYWARAVQGAGCTVATLSTAINPGDTAPLHFAALKALGPVDILPANAPLAARLLLIVGKLRQYRPKAIVLVINPQDVMTVGALGGCEHAPVIFLDHADHCYWLGQTVSDKVIEYRVQGIDNALNKRQVSLSKVENVPLLCGYDTTDHAGLNIRALHRVPPKAPLSLTVATAYKLFGAKTWDYFDTILEMLQRNKQQHHIVVVNEGADVLNRLDVMRQSPKNKDALSRCHIVGPVPHDDLEAYYRQSDFLIESWPFPGATVRYEALSLGLPIVVVDSGDNPSEIELMGLPGYVKVCQSKEAFNVAVWDMVINPDLRAAQAQMSRAFFDAHFDRETVTRRIVETVKEFMP